MESRFRYAVGNFISPAYPNLIGATGRTLDPRHTGLVDSYYAHEGNIVAVVDSLIRVSYPGTIYYKVEPERTTIMLDSLSKRMNAFYDFKRRGAYTSMGGEVLRGGTLKDDIFQNEQLTFLAGVFLRFGKKCDSAYCINITASSSKGQDIQSVIEGGRL